MRASLLLVGVMLAAGCGDSADRQPKPRVVYPALNESPPPPSPGEDAEEASEVAPSDPPAEVNEEGWFQRQAQMDEQIQRLRDYAARAEPDDPFALTEKEISELSKRDELVIY